MGSSGRTIRVQQVHPNGMITETLNLNLPPDDLARLRGLLQDFGGSPNNPHRVLIRSTKKGLLMQITEPGELPERGDGMFIVRLRDIME